MISTLNDACVQKKAASDRKDFMKLAGCLASHKVWVCVVQIIVVHYINSVCCVSLCALKRRNCSYKKEMCKYTPFVNPPKKKPKKKTKPTTQIMNRFSRDVTSVHSDNKDICWSEVILS